MDSAIWMMLIAFVLMAYLIYSYLTSSFFHINEIGSVTADNGNCQYSLDNLIYNEGCNKAFKSSLPV